MNDMTAAMVAGAGQHAQDSAQVLPNDGLQGTLVGRVWAHGAIPGPAVVALRPEGVFDLSATYPYYEHVAGHSAARAGGKQHPGPAHLRCG